MSVRPKKSLGQHFLRDENIARKIVDSLDLPDKFPVLEIGPGMGVLTKYTLEQVLGKDTLQILKIGMLLALVIQQ